MAIHMFVQTLLTFQYFKNDKNMEAVNKAALHH